LIKHKSGDEAQAEDGYKPYEDYMYETVFIFQKKKLKITLLDNWSAEIFPVRLLDNICFMCRVLVIKITLFTPSVFFLATNLANCAIFYLTVFRVRRKKYHKLLIYFKIKWILEFLAVTLVSVCYFTEYNLTYGNFLVYFVVIYMIFNLMTPVILIIHDFVTYLKTRKKKKK
jgi:hypothetical protein